MAGKTQMSMRTCSALAHFKIYLIKWSLVQIIDVLISYQ